jgi:hypothetical protein
VLEVPIYERRGLRVIDVRAATFPLTFLNVAGSRVGIFLGRESLPEDKKLHGAPIVGIEVTSDGFNRIHRRLGEKQSVKFDGPRLRERLGPKAQSILLQDPFGNHLELIEKDRPAAHNGSAYLGLNELELRAYARDDSFQPEQHHPVGGHLELVELRPAWTVGCHEPSYDSTYVTGNAPLLARRRVSFRGRKLRNLH